MAIDERFCKANGSKSDVVLLWKIDNLPSHSKKKNKKTHTPLFAVKSGTFVIISSLEYRTSIIPSNISCLSVGQNSIESVTLYADILTYEKDVW